MWTSRESCAGFAFVTGHPDKNDTGARVVNVALQISSKHKNLHFLREAPFRDPVCCRAMHLVPAV